MKYYTVSSKTKKNVVETETWYNEERQLYMEIEQLWRWGQFTVAVDDDDEPPSEEGPFYSIDWPIEDQELDDGISMDFRFWHANPDEELTDVELESIEEEMWNLWDEMGYTSFEENGWEHEESETVMFGELEVTECE